MISWPPTAVALYFGRRKLHQVTARQTAEIAEMTEEQTRTLLEP
jgi:hypothetical protein